MSKTYQIVMAAVDGEYVTESQIQEISTGMVEITESNSGW